MPRLPFETYPGAVGSERPQVDGQKQLLLQRVWNTIRPWVFRGSSSLTNPIQERRTTEGGSQKLSQSQDQLQRDYIEPKTRRDMMRQVRRTLADNPLIYAAWKKYAEGALGTGFHVIVTRTSRTGYVAQRQAFAQRVVDRINKKCKLQRKAQSWARWLVAEGDLFLQLKVAMNSEGYFEIIDIKKMPAANMRRMSDDREEFPDPSRAYAQTDLNIDKTIAEFAEWQIVHARFDHEDGNRYGNSLIFPMRVIAAKALEATISLADRRKANHPTLAHILKDKDGNRVGETQMEEYKRSVSKTERIKRGSYSEYEELFVNGGDVKAILTDTNIDKIDDVTFLYDVALSPTGVSRQLIGSGVTVNRDVLDEQRSELYAIQRQLADLFAEEVFKPIFDMGLMLAGIDPENVQYHILFKQRYTESAMERRIDRAQKSRDLKAGPGLSQEDLMSVQADYFDIEDIEEAVMRIQEEENSSNSLTEGAIMPPNGLPGPAANSNDGSTNQQTGSKPQGTGLKEKIKGMGLFQGLPSKQRQQQALSGKGNTNGNGQP